jgi:hypothetical protein
MMGGHKKERCIMALYNVMVTLMIWIIVWTLLFFVLLVVRLFLLSKGI